MIRAVCCSHLAIEELEDILAVRVTLSKILKAECAVLRKHSEAIPEDATNKTFFPCLYITSIIIRIKSVLPEPPGPSMKDISDSVFLML